MTGIADALDDLIAATPADGRRVIYLGRQALADLEDEVRARYPVVRGRYPWGPRDAVTQYAGVEIQIVHAPADCAYVVAYGEGG